MAGGRGRRLGELTKDIPKPLLEFEGVPFLRYLINSLPRALFHEVLILTDYKADLVEEFVQSTRWPFKVSTHRRAQSVETAAALKDAEDKLDEYFVVLHGDTFILLSDLHWLSFVVAGKKNTKQGPTMLVSQPFTKRTDWNPNVEVFSISAPTTKARIGVGSSEHMFFDTGVAFMSKDYLDNPTPQERLIDLYRRLGEQDKLFAHVIVGKSFIDIGTPEDVELFSDLIAGFRMLGLFARRLGNLW